MKNVCAKNARLFPLAAGLVFTAASLLTSCSRKPAGDGKVHLPPVPVLVANVETRDVPVEIRVVGNVQAYSTVAVRSQITGPIMQVHFEEGQEVKAGDPLFTIDPRPFVAALNQTRASLKRDEAQLLSARLAFQRTSNLFETKIASQQDYETAEAAFNSAEATVLAGAAAISNAQISLDYTDIRSAVDGRTGSLSVKAGNVVKAPDDVLLTITQIRPIYVAFSVPEQQLPAIRRRAAEAVLPVRAIVAGETNNPAWGELTFIDNAVDMNTGTILLRGTFANTNTVLWPGQFAQVTLTLAQVSNAVVVPAQAVQTGQNGQFVFVVQPDETVEMRAVTTGVNFEGGTVVSSGLEAGETVVTDGQLRLFRGARVSVKSAETSANSTSVVTNAGK
jgi:membrane fusion protein, multidrug efflux system